MQDVIRRPLGKGHSTPKRVTTRRLRTTDLEGLGIWLFLSGLIASPTSSHWMLSPPVCWTDSTPVNGMTCGSRIPTQCHHTCGMSPPPQHGGMVTQLSTVSVRPFKSQQIHLPSTPLLPTQQPSFYLPYKLRLSGRFYLQKYTSDAKQKFLNHWPRPIVYFLKIIISKEFT